MAGLVPNHTMMIATAENYAGIVSQRVTAERHALAGEWLRRLKQLLTVEPNEVFPSQQLLDHIPTFDWRDCYLSPSAG